MKDFLGNELEIDDYVVLTAPFYRHFARGKIIQFTPKKVRVEYTNNWNYSDGMICNYLSDPEFLVKIKEV